MLKLSLFASRQVTAINVVTAVFYGASSAAGHLVLLQCQPILGYTATEGGPLFSSPSSLIFLVHSPISRALVRRIGPCRLMTGGIFAVAAGLGGLAYAPSARARFPARRAVDRGGGQFGRSGA